MKTKHVAIGLVAVGLLTSQNVKGEIAYRNQENAQNNKFGASLREQERYAEQQAKLSSVALARVKAGFIPVLGAPGKEKAFVEGQTVVAALGSATRLGDGTIVANSMGHTGIVQDGVLTQIAIANSSDMPEYQEYFWKGRVIKP